MGVTEPRFGLWTRRKRKAGTEVPAGLELVARTGFEPVILRPPAGLFPFRITKVETSPAHRGPTAVGSENRGVSILGSALSRAAGVAVPAHLASQPIRLLYDVLQLPHTVKPWSEAMKLIGAFPGS